MLHQEKVLLHTTLMLHQEKVLLHTTPTTPTTPMLLDTILMILMDAKVLLDMTLILHQEKVPTLTPTTPVLLDMIRVHLDMILVIQTLQERAPDLIPMHQGKLQALLDLVKRTQLMKHPEK